MKKAKCTYCGVSNDEYAYFCSGCSSLLIETLEETVEVSEKFKDIEFKLHRITDNLKEIPHIDIIWNHTVNEFARKVEKIQSLTRLNDLGINSHELNEKIKVFLNNCRKPDFEIAFVGAVKAGKSTLINALLGKNYASTDVNPETAVLTKFRASDKDYVRVKFYNEDEWNHLWNSAKGAKDFNNLYKELNAENEKPQWINHGDEYKEVDAAAMEEELKAWSSSQSPKHFFVKEIEAGISTLPKSFPKQVVFVDTPGLFDPVDFRSQISRDYIQKANAVLTCIKAESLYSEEVKAVEAVCSFLGKKRDKVFIIATNWDKLNNIITDWNKRYKHMIDTFTGDAFYPNREIAAKNILPADAFHYNLLRDYNNLTKAGRRAVNEFLYQIQGDIEAAAEKGIEIPNEWATLMEAEMNALTPGDIQRLINITNVNRVNDVIVKEFVNQYTDILLDRINTLYDDIRQIAARNAGERKDDLQGFLNTMDNDNLEEIERQLKAKTENMEKIQMCEEQLSAALERLNEDTRAKLADTLQNIY